MKKSLEELVAFVNEQIAFHKSCVEAFASTPWRARKHEETIEGLQQVQEALSTKFNGVRQRVASDRDSFEAPQQLRLSLTPDEVDGLPEELTNELSASSFDKTELTIVGILEDRGGIASLDQILVGLYKRTNEIHKRNTLTSRLYRMSNRSLIFSVPTKKGVYSLRRLSAEDVSRFFGQDSEERLD